MGGHFDAVGFSNPARGFGATREYLRAAVERGRELGPSGEVVYHQLESAEGCGLVAATDGAGFLLNGCPYFRGELRQAVEIEQLLAWDEAEPHQGGALGQLVGTGGAGLAVAFALPHFALAAEQALLGRQLLGLAGLGYRASTHATGHGQTPYLQPVRERPDGSANRRCDLDCRGRIERARLFENGLTGARLAYALLDCGSARLEVVLDLASLDGGLAEGASLEGNFWLVASPPGAG